MAQKTTRKNGMPTKNILIIDSNSGYGDYLRILMEEACSSVLATTAGSLEAALDMLHRDLFDAILLDLKVPNGDKEGVAAKLSGEFPWTPIIVIASLEDRDLAASLLRNGAEDYLIRPGLTPSRLFDAIRFGIERHRRAMERRGLLLEAERILIRLKAICPRLAQHEEAECQATTTQTVSG
jgi:DNA-binding response OmpR family regulator